MFHKDLTGADIHETKITVNPSTPISSLTPSATGILVVADDTKVLYKSTGLTSADWEIVSPSASGLALGAGGSGTLQYDNGSSNLGSSTDLKWAVSSYGGGAYGLGINLSATGAPTPGYAFDVNGIIKTRASSDSGGAGGFMLSDPGSSGGTWAIRKTVTGHNLAFDRYAGSWSTVMTILNSNGYFGIGTVSPGATLDIVTSSGPGARMTYYGTGSPGLQTRKARGTPGGETAIQSGDALGSQNHDGVTWAGAGGFGVTAAETWSNPSNHGCYLTFNSTASATASPTEKMRLMGGGALCINATAPVGTEKLYVNGSINSTGFKMVDGTQGAGHVLTSDANGVASWQPVDTPDDTLQVVIDNLLARVAALEALT